MEKIKTEMDWKEVDITKQGKLEKNMLGGMVLKAEATKEEEEYNIFTYTQLNYVYGFQDKF